MPNYWDSVANKKTFTHPLNFHLLEQFVNKEAFLVDYGCGYGRSVQELNKAGFSNVKGFDMSVELIRRGNLDGVKSVFHISSADVLPVEENSVDCIVLFAVLTCIPSNAEQMKLINILHSKLRRNGVIYISDYYLQKNSTEMDRYDFLDGDQDNFGVFTLPEGIMFRHHTRDWIATLLKDFYIEKEIQVEVKTMNGNNAEAFQLIARKK